MIWVMSLSILGPFQLIKKLNLERTNDVKKHEFSYLTWQHCKILSTLVEFYLKITSKVDLGIKKRK